VNACAACGLDFAGLEAFDRHRVGVHAYRFEEGLRMEPPRDDGRRCLTDSEMGERGWRRDGRGRWFDPVRTSRAARLRCPSPDAVASPNRSA
jgi:hypothetical protein